MAFDYYLANVDSLNKVKIPEWFGVTDLKQKQHLVGGLIDYFGVFTRAQVMEASNKYNVIGNTEKKQHAQGLEYLQQSDADEFKVTAIYWESGMDLEP